MSTLSSRQRRRRRLALIGSVFLILIGVVVGRWLMVRGSSSSTPPAQQVTQDHQRALGLAAFADGHEVQAMAQLSPLATEDSEDLEVLYALAQLHDARAVSDVDHLLAAVTLYRRVLSLNSDHVGATRRLLELMIKHPTNVESEILRLAERLLREDPTDPLALRGQVIAYTGTQRLDDALASADLYLSAQPLDIAMLRRRLDLLKAKGWLTEKLLDETWTLREAHPDAAEPLLAEAYARLITDDSEASLGWLERANQVAPPDLAYISQAVEIYDRNSRYDLSLAYLEKLHEQDNRFLPVDELARRYFEADRFTQASELIAQLDDPSLALQSVRVLALLRDNDRAGALAVIDQLEPAADGPDSAGPAAVAEFLRRCASEDTPADDIITADTALLAAGVRNPYLDFVVGQAYVVQGSPAEARSRFEKALKIRPVWAAPGLELAKLLREQGDHVTAARYALAASQRQRNSLNARVELALSLGARPNQLVGQQKNQLVSLIDNIQEARPGEPRTLALRVDVLASTGDAADANATARSALDLDPPLDEPDLLRLITVAERHNLPARDTLRSAYAQRFGQTLRLTMRQANEIATTRSPDAALAHFDAARPDAPSPEWDVNRILLLEQTDRRDESRAAWNQVASAYPDQPQVQRVLLQSPVAWSDPALIQATIDRLKKIDDDGSEWRTAQARLWLSEENSETSGQQIIAVLEPVPVTAQVRFMQASAQQNLGNTDAALTLLRDAVRLNPGLTAAQLTLARLLIEQDDTAAVLDVARSLTTQSNLAPPQQRAVAGLLLQLGDTDRARSLLESLNAQGQLQPGDALALAQLYQRINETPAALQLIPRMMEQPSAASISFVADLYARQGNNEAAQKTLLQLDSAGVPAAEAQTIRAAHQAVHGNAEDALTTFQEVVQANPQQPQGWTNLLSLQLQNNQLDDALATARRAADALPDHTGFAALTDHADDLRRLRTRDDQGINLSLALALVRDPDDREAAAEVIRRLATFAGRPEGSDLPRRERASAIIELADRYPHFELVQRLAVVAYLETDRTQAGLDAAQRTMQRFPDSAAAAQLATEAWSSAERWREAVVAAEAWSNRTRGDRAPADATVARLHRLLNRPNIALQRLQRYRQLWASPGSANSGQLSELPPELQQTLLREYILSLAAAGRFDEAWTLLEPRLSTDPVCA